MGCAYGSLAFRHCQAHEARWPGWPITSGRCARTPAWPADNVHLSKVTGTVGDQRRWIADYKAREAAGREFYYVIARSDGTRCGLVRLYDIGPDRFTWGSWILDHNKPPKAALESAVRIYDIGFGRLAAQNPCSTCAATTPAPSPFTAASARKRWARMTSTSISNTRATGSRRIGRACWRCPRQAGAWMTETILTTGRQRPHDRPAAGPRTPAGAI